MSLLWPEMAVVVTVDGNIPGTVASGAVVFAFAVSDETEDGAGTVTVVGSSARLIGLEDLDLGVERRVFEAAAGCCTTTVTDGVERNGDGKSFPVSVGGAAARFPEG